jgi:hypothetical protein
VTGCEWRIRKNCVPIRALQAAIDTAERTQNLVGARRAREALEAVYATRPQPRTM